MIRDDLLEWRIGILDDQDLKGYWAQITTAGLKNQGYDVRLVLDPEALFGLLKEHSIDVAIIDLELGASESGLDIARKIRRTNTRIPIILVTGDPDFLDTPIAEFADLLAGGPTVFHSKVGETPIATSVRVAIAHVDPLWRAAAALAAARKHTETLRIGGKEYTLSQLMDLEAADPNDSVRQSLSEAFRALLLEIVGKGRGAK